MAIIGRGDILGRQRVAAGAALLLAGLAPAGARAQVVLDGAVGPAGALAGPDYAIGAELGRRAGANLFHSFARFGLRTGESATFSGPAGIANVISRVTGGERSDIDGTLRSTVPGADLWFINPAGVTFGPNARLDVPGSLHVGTADELRFADGARFGATDPAGSRLTVAAPEAFGFLGAEPGAIRVAGSLLEVPPGADLSLVGGDVSVEVAAIVARGGRIGLAGTAGPAEVAPGAADDGGDFGGGTVTVDGAFIDAGGLGGGTVALRGGGIAVTGRSFLVATSFGDAASGASRSSAPTCASTTASPATTPSAPATPGRSSSGPAGWRRGTGPSSPPTRPRGAPAPGATSPCRSARWP